ncbi:hypothetical protein BKA61DRAFT_573786 [Leptodontidium sp. MPI-SDFR-AT-0119]|nr:hypothetical protein BKA61DRAFT_573786 [Leptodontidium sp. MPI-SDFR-AT-0119]
MRLHTKRRPSPRPRILSFSIPKVYDSSTKTPSGGSSRLTYGSMLSKTASVVLVVLTLAISWAIISLRFYLRLHSRNKFHWTRPDITIIVSLIFQFSLSLLSLLTLLLSPDPKSLVLLYNAGSLLYLCTLWSIKLSISFFLLQLTQQLDRAHQIARFGLYTICATFVVLVILLAAGYIPISTLPGQARAARFTSVFWTSVALNVGTDIILIGTPFLVLSLLTEKRTRIAVSIVFGLAGIVIVVAIIRAILIDANEGTGNFLIVVLSHIEIATGVIITTIPVISRGFTRMYLRGSSVGNSRNQVPEIRQGSQRVTVGSEFGSLGAGSSSTAF